MTFISTTLNHVPLSPFGFCSDSYRPFEAARVFIPPLNSPCVYLSLTRDLGWGVGAVT